MMKLECDQRLPTLNEYIKAVNGSRWAGASLKRKYTEELAWKFKKQAAGKTFNSHVTIFIDFYESNNRRDDDGVMHGMKYILDGLQEAGIIKNDSPKYCHVLPEVLRSQKKDGNGKIIDYVEISIYESEAVR